MPITSPNAPDDPLVSENRRITSPWLAWLTRGGLQVLVNLVTEVIGILRVVNGGTGRATLTNHGVVVGAGTSPVNVTAAGATNTLLHGVTGADPTYSAVVEADLSLSDVTTANVSITKHGFTPKAPNDATKFLDGTGAYSTPAGAGSVTTTGSPASGNLTKFSGATSVTNADLTGDVTTAGTVATTLSASGASAGTYGSATVAPVITVDAKGRITTVTTATITPGAGTGGAMSLIAGPTTLGADAATFTFSAIAGTYTHLLLIGKGRLTEVATENYLQVQFNADTGANYDFEMTYEFGNTANNGNTFASTFGRVGDWPAANATANYPGVLYLSIPFYAETTFYKTAISDMASQWAQAGQAVAGGKFVVNYRSTAAITQILLKGTGVDGSGKSLKAGSVFALYGIA